jgi:hypothetical protein
MKWGFLSKMFEGVVGIEKTYNQCDKAINGLRAYNKKLDEMRENEDDPNSYPADKKAELDETVNRAIRGATLLLNKESERNWVGVFREMHKNLASIYVEQGEYDKARKECEHLEKYGEVGAADAEEIQEALKEKAG